MHQGGLGTYSINFRTVLGCLSDAEGSSKGHPLNFISMAFSGQVGIYKLCELSSLYDGVCLPKKKTAVNNLLKPKEKNHFF